MTQILMNKISDIISQAKNISIYSHINSDCDAMGSMLAMRDVLINLGKSVDVYSHSGFPSNFEFFEDLKYVNKKSCDKYDLVICLDTPTENRLGKYKFSYRKGVKNSILIDHHEHSNEEYCKINLVKKSSSTAEILYELFKYMNIEFTAKICKNLVSGILTDTGKFMHSLTSETLTVVSELIKLGNLDMDDICNKLFNSMELNAFELVKLAYNKLELYSNNKLAIIMLSQDDFKKTNSSLNDTDTLADISLSLKSVQFAILASEDDMGYFRVSFRSKGDISARIVAETFGGGGHKNASGCKIFGEFDEVKERLINNTFECLGWRK